MPGEESVGRLFASGSVVEQIAVWGLLYEVVSTLFRPLFNELQQGSSYIFPNELISPADLTTLVQRSAIHEHDAAEQARLSGLSADKFHLMLALRRLPPGVQQVVEMAWRGVVPWDADPTTHLSVQDAVRESDISNDWYAVIRALFDPTQQNGGQSIPISDVVDALVESQVDEATGARLAAEVGFNLERLTILRNTRGNPPGPAELIEAVRRGFIPLDGTGPDALSLQQGIFEGATKNKWFAIYKLLTDYLPPPRTVTALQRAGAISADQAQALYKQQGLSATLAAAYVANASTDKVAAHKQVAESIITALYRDAAIDAPTATSMLGKLGFDANEAHFILEVQDLQRVQKYIESAITRIHNVFVNHKIPTDSAKNALSSLDVPSPQIDHLIQTWTLERAENVRVLTPAQIEDLFALEIFSQDEATQELTQLGYSPFDAWALLSNKIKRELPGKPPRNAAIA